MSDPAATDPGSDPGRLPADPARHPADPARRRGRDEDPPPSDRSGHRRRGEALPPILLAVFTAGVLGTAARLAVDALLPAAPGGVPLSTLVINTVGSFALGVVVGAVPHSAPEWLRAALTTGFLGAFTTFSALTVASVTLTGSGGLLSAGVLLAVSVVAGVLAAAAGIAVGAAMLRRAA